MIKYGTKSIKNLVGVHPLLNIFAYKVMLKMQARQMTDAPFTDFGVFEGLRTMKRQKYLFSKKVTKTLDSYHLYGLALDLVVYVPNVGYTWDTKRYKNNWDILKDVCSEVIEENNYSIESPFKWDLAHYQMSGYKTLFDARKILKGLI